MVFTTKINIVYVCVYVYKIYFLCDLLLSVTLLDIKHSEDRNIFLYSENYKIKFKSKIIQLIKISTLELP